MAAKRVDDIARFLRVADQRYDDAQHLLVGSRNTGSVYLAGYSIECGLKALLISTRHQRADRSRILASFRGTHGHNLESLKARYLKQQGPRVPDVIVDRLIYANRWTIDLRYDPSDLTAREAGRFLDAAKQILDWIKGRI